jgi:hypothetical protein
MIEIGGMYKFCSTDRWRKTPTAAIFKINDARAVQQMFKTE